MRLLENLRNLTALAVVLLLWPYSAQGQSRSDDPGKILALAELSRRLDSWGEHSANVHILALQTTIVGRLRGEDSIHYASSKALLSIAMESAGNRLESAKTFAEAERVARNHRDDPQYSTFLTLKAQRLLDAKQWSSARAILRQVNERARTLEDDDPFGRAKLLTAEASTLTRLGKFAEAETLYASSMNIIAERVSAQDHNYHHFYGWRGVNLYRSGNRKEGATLLRKGFIGFLAANSVAAGLGCGWSSHVAPVRDWLTYHFRALLEDATSSADIEEALSVAEILDRSRSSDGMSLVSAERYAGTKGLAARCAIDEYDIRHQRQAQVLKLTETSSIDQITESQYVRAPMSRPIGTPSLGPKPGAKRFSDEYFKLAHSLEPTLSDIRGSLKNNEALIRFFESPDVGGVSAEWFAFVSTSEASRWIKIATSSARINALVTTLRCGLDADMWRSQRLACESAIGGTWTTERTLPFSLSAASELYNLLLAPMPEIKSKASLVVIAGGALSRIPLQVLVTDWVKNSPSNFEGVAWLGAKQTISYWPSISTATAHRKDARTTAARRPYLGIGNPILLGRSREDRSALQFKDCSSVSTSSRRGGSKRATTVNRSLLQRRGELMSLDPLPETAEELCDAANRFGRSEDATVLLGSNATKMTLVELARKDELANYRILHFATHGLKASEARVFGRAEPALVLTPISERDDLDNGLLTVYEVLQMRFDAELIILSACNTAAGDELSLVGETYEGLARAFLLSGAHSVLVSHWYVDSHATVELIKQFATAYGVGRKRDSAAAIRSAIQSLIKRGFHPSQWAPFVVVGG